MSPQLKEEMASMYPSSTKSTPSSSTKWKISLLSGIIFLIISAPMLYKLTDGLLKKISPSLSLCDYSGCPTQLGLIVHAIVFVLITRMLMW